MKINLKKNLTILLFLFIALSAFTKDRMPETRLTISPFKDTVVSGFDSELIIYSDYDIKNLSVSGTGCTIMLKDADKGIFVITAPQTSVGKTSTITVSVRHKNGTVTELLKREVKIVAMTTSMRKRYANNLNYKK